MFAARFCTMETSSVSRVLPAAAVLRERGGISASLEIEATVLVRWPGSTAQSAAVAETAASAGLHCYHLVE